MFTKRCSDHQSGHRGAGVDHRLVDLVHRLLYTNADKDVADKMVSLISDPVILSASELTASPHAYQWFLDRAKDNGIELTSAGYLKPADVRDASKVVSAMDDWIGANNREVRCAPLFDFRQSLQSLGCHRAAAVAAPGAM